MEINKQYENFIYDTSNTNYMTEFSKKHVFPVKSANREDFNNQLKIIKNEVNTYSLPPIVEPCSSSKLPQSNLKQSSSADAEKPRKKL